MRLSRGKLAELKRMGYAVEDTPEPDTVILTPVPKKPSKKKAGKVAAPTETSDTKPKEWKFSVIRDEFGYIKDINAKQIT